jgi:hypothetical protein
MAHGLWRNAGTREWQGMHMAYTDITGSFDTAKPQGGTLRRFLSSFFAARSDRMAAAPAPRKLAGPLPGDKRARGYMADLDIEVGF